MYAYLHKSNIYTYIGFTKLKSKTIFKFSYFSIQFIEVILQFSFFLFIDLLIG